MNRSRMGLIISQGLMALIGLVSGKLIAVCFTPEVFGLFNLQFTAYTFFFTLFFTPLLQFAKTKYRLLLKTGYLTIAYFAAISAVFMIAILFGLMALSMKMNVYLLAMLPVMIVSNIIYNSLTDYLNIQGKLGPFAASSLMKNVGGVVLLLFFYYFLKDMGENTTLLWGVQIISFLTGTVFFLRQYPLRMRSLYFISLKTFFRKYIIFAWPLIILSFWTWFSNYSDRYVIAYYLTIRDVGIYNAAYSVGSKFFLLLNPLFLAVLVPVIYGELDVASKKKQIVKYVRYYALISFPLLLVILLMKDKVGALLLSAQYSDGFYLIFWVALAYFFMTVTFLYETIFYAKGNTGPILYTNIISALVGLLLDFIFIPFYGLMGAAIALVASFAVRLFIFQIYFRKI